MKTRRSERHELSKLSRKRFILQTAEWFYCVRQHDAILSDIGSNLKEALKTTVNILVKAAKGETYLPSYMSMGEYQHLLTSFLMHLDYHDRTNISEDVLATVIEVSTHFYNELTRLFKYMKLSDYQVKTMTIVGFIGDDLVVDIVY